MELESNNGGSILNINNAGNVTGVTKITDLSNNIVSLAMLSNGQIIVGLSLSAVYLVDPITGVAINGLYLGTGKVLGLILSPDESTIFALAVGLNQTWFYVINESNFDMISSIELFPGNSCFAIDTIKEMILGIWKCNSKWCSVLMPIEISFLLNQILQTLLLSMLVIR